jgi:hypothetical protein
MNLCGFWAERSFFLLPANFLSELIEILHLLLGMGYLVDQLISPERGNVK